MGVSPPLKVSAMRNDIAKLGRVIQSYHFRMFDQTVYFIQFTVLLWGKEKSKTVT